MFPEAVPANALLNSQRMQWWPHLQEDPTAPAMRNLPADTANIPTERE